MTDPPDQDETELQRLLGCVNSAVLDGDLAQALRCADAARRLAPDSPDVSHLLGRLLLHCGRAELALAELDRGAAMRPCADVEASAVDALRALERLEAAADRLHRALRDFSVEFDAPLARAARALILERDAAVQAWTGLTPRLEPWGEAVGSPGAPEIEAFVGDSPLRLEATLEDASLGLWRFRAQSSLERLEGTLAVVAKGAPAAGSGAVLPLDFAADGRCEWIDGEARGWASVGWRPGHSPDVEVIDDLGRPRAVRTEPDPAHPGRHLFSFDPAALGVARSSFALSIVLPDGRRTPLPDSPVLMELPAAPRGRRRRGRARARPSRMIDVVIPVYKGLEETLACIRSVAATVGPDAEIVVVDDASPDPELAAALAGLAAEGAITLIRNDRNLGFSAAVNRGVLLHRDRDVVVLNADAEVYPGWLERLRRIARSEPAIGTVTPLSNTGSIASYPPGEGSDCSPQDAARIAAVAARVNQGETVDAPTGVGHCMFIARACLDETGPLDAEVFGRGYGEENDFCLRASRLGWRHVLSGEVFVRHAGARSFGKGRDALLERNLKILNRRWAGYDAMIQDWISAKAARPMLRRIDEAVLAERQADAVLIVTLGLAGGVARFVQERIEALRGQGLDVLVLKPAPDTDEARLEVKTAAGEFELDYDIPGEAAAIKSLLGALPIRKVEFHHFLGLNARLVEAVLDLGITYEVFIHDYAWICPRVTLIGGEGRYCGEPAIKACEACRRTHGSRLEKRLTVRRLRDRSLRWLSGAERIIAPAQDVADRLARYFPDLPLEARPWEAAPPVHPVPKVADRARVKVAVVGAIGDHKGYEVLLDCARDAAAREAPLEFVLIGFSKDDEALRSAGIFVTGEYQESEAPDLIRREAPDVVFIPSVWPETWCYALTHALSAGLPIVAFDLGAIAERLRRASAASDLLPLGHDAASINDRLLHAAARASAPIVLQSSPQPLSSDEIATAPPQTSRYEPPDPAPDLASHINTHQTARNPMPESQTGLTSSVEVLSLNKGVYLFSVKSASPRRVGDEGEMVLPALHVGPAPGVDPAHVEIMTGLRAEDAWLFERRDMLIVKVMATPTMLLATSLRAQGMPALELTLERLDGKREPAAAPAGLLTHQAVTAPQPSAAMPVAPAATSQAPAPPAYLDQQGRRMLRTQVMAHLRSRGDTTYVDALWAGAPGESLPIEAFSIVPLEGVTPDLIEYKGLTSTGVETPWISGGAVCGTRGMDVPLVGFAVRLKPGFGDRYECEYRGAFRSGRIIGPLSNGAPCRASASDDYLEGLQISIVERPAAPEWSVPPSEPVVAESRRTGPRFSVFREDVQ